MSSLLITGGLGYIGSHTVATLYKQGNECIIIDNLSNAQIIVHQKLEQLTGKSITFYHGDIRDAKLLQEIFTNHNIDGVIHFAGLKAVGESCQEPFLYYENNINGTVNLLHQMVKYHIRNIIFSSTACVYDIQQSNPPFDEQAAVGNCSNPYGTTKILIEQIIKDVCLHQGIAAITLRYFNPIGAHVSGLLGENPQGTPNNLFPYIFKVATGELDQLTIFGDDRPTRDGTGERDYIHIQDLVDGHSKAREHLEKQKSGYYDVFNLGSNQGTTVTEALQLVQQTINKQIPHHIGSRRAGDVAVSIADASKANTILTRQTNHTLQDAISNARNYYQNP